MADAAANAIAIIDETKRIIRWAIDFWNAPEEQQSVKNELENLEIILQRLREMCEEAEPGAPWLKSLWRECGERGTLVELQLILGELANSMHPTNKIKKSRFVQRSIWHWKKEKITDLQNRINKALQFILTELGLKHDMMLTEVIDAVGKARKLIEFGLDGIDERLSRIELHQTEEDARWRKEEAEKAREKADLEREEIMAWLSPLSFIAKREQLFNECFKETGDWLWQDQRFKCWTEGRQWPLYCIGDMGVGKTVLSSILTRRLPANPRAPLILNLYLNYKASKAQTAESLVCSMLKQVFQLDEERPIPEALSKLYRLAKHIQTSADNYQDQISEILWKELEKYSEFYIVVDGSDELQSLERSKLLKKLQKLPRNKSKVVIMTRPIQGETRKKDVEEYPNCDNPKCEETNVRIWYRCIRCNDGTFDLCLACKNRGFWCLDRLHELKEPYDHVPISVEIPAKDIERYVKWQINPDPSENDGWCSPDERVAGPDGLTTTAFEDLYTEDPDLLEEIICVVTEKANGRFLFARLYMDSLKMASNRKTIRRILRNFPDDIDDIYKGAMDRIKSQRPERNRDKAFKILGLVAHARRALSMSEIKHGLAAMELEEDDEDIEYNILGATDKAKTILDCTSALIVEEKRDQRTASVENSNPEIRLVHRTLEDFLHKDENERQWMKNIESDIAKACLAYLRIVLPSRFQGYDDDYYHSRSAKFPFLAYASQYWGDHVRCAVSESASNTSIQELTLQMLNDAARLQGSIQAAWAVNWGSSDSWDTWRQLDRLHVCAWNGLSFAISALDPDPEHVDVMEPKYRQTPLMYACRRNHVEVVTQLLRLGASCRAISARGRTALFEAIGAQHTEIVDLFLIEKPPDLDINAIHPEQYCRTALMLATREGLIDIVRTLLSYPGINVDAQDANGWTALYIAVKFGYKDLVAVLLEAKPNIELKDNQDGRFALRCAAERAENQESDEMVILGLLLEYGANTNTRDKRGGTAILRAVNLGKLDAVQTIMNHNGGSYFGEMMICRDENGQTLLHGASRKGHTDIAQWLLSFEYDVNPRDKAGRTPLHLASQYGHLTTLKVLLEASADATLVDDFDRTPKKVAWQYGHETIVEALESDVAPPSEPQMLPKAGQLPLWAMVLRDLSDIFLEALAARPEELRITEPFMRNTLLHCAVEVNSPAFLGQLLSLPNSLPIDTENHVGRTPLHLAAVKGLLPLVELLITHGAALDVKDSWNDEALFLAQSNYMYDVMFVLLEAGAYLDKVKIETRALFFKAVDERRARTIHILLEKWGVDRSMQNKEGVRAINIARAHDDTAMELVLRSAPTVNVGGLPGLDNNGQAVSGHRTNQRPTKLPKLDEIMSGNNMPLPMRSTNPQEPQREVKGIHKPCDKLPVQ